MRVGLRAQIVLSLSVVFLLAMPLLVTVTVQLSRHAAEQHRRRIAEIVADGTDSAPGPRGRALSERLSRLATSGDAAETEQRLQRMLILYVGMTWLAVIGLAYVLLTMLIVRPLEQVVRSSQSLASGTGVERLDEKGPAELHRLATTFNDMASQLRRERLALEQRLQELQRTTDALSVTQRHLARGEKLATVGRMAAGLAHEVGNPLSAILGMVELLRNQQLSPQEQAEFLARIQSETERIHGIIRDLLDFSRRDAAGDGEPQQADLSAVIEDAVALLSPQKAAKDIAVQVHIREGLPPVHGSRTRLTQVLLNLLLNAVDALDGRGAIVVEAQPSPTTGDCPEVCLSVQDDGPGIAPEMLERLFEPFATSKPVGQGTGLGLAVSHSLIEGMGGEMTATNCPGGGARFEVRLRAAA